MSLPSNELAAKFEEKNKAELDQVSLQQGKQPACVSLPDVNQPKCVSVLPNSMSEEELLKLRAAIVRKDQEDKLRQEDIKNKSEKTSAPLKNRIEIIKQELVEKRKEAADLAAAYNEMEEKVNALKKAYHYALADGTLDAETRESIETQDQNALQVFETMKALNKEIDKLEQEKKQIKLAAIEKIKKSKLYFSDINGYNVDEYIESMNHQDNKPGKKLFTQIPSDQTPSTKKLSWKDLPYFFRSSEDRKCFVLDYYYYDFSINKQGVVKAEFKLMEALFDVIDGEYKTGFLQSGKFVPDVCQPYSSVEDLIAAEVNYQAVLIREESARDQAEELTHVTVKPIKLVAELARDAMTFDDFIKNDYLKREQLKEQKVQAEISKTSNANNDPKAEMPKKLEADVPKTAISKQLEITSADSLQDDLSNFSQELDKLLLETDQLTEPKAVTPHLAPKVLVKSSQLLANGSTQQNTNTNGQLFGFSLASFATSFSSSESDAWLDPSKNTHLDHKPKAKTHRPYQG